MLGTPVLFYFVLGMRNGKTITISVVVDEGPVHNDGFGICLDVRKLFISESGSHQCIFLSCV
jgi:hypothetical protein